MATARLGKRVKDSFLPCSICIETYTDPCTLTCDHTFCRKCVTKYIQTRPDAVQSKTISCDFCRRDTKVPHPSRPVEEFTGKIKPRIIIQGLIDTFVAEGDVPETSSTCCTICQQIGETTPGALWCPECEVALCDRCVKTHRVSPILQNHDLCDLSSRSKSRRRFKCTEHKSNNVEFHCKDCQKPACQTCCIIHHRACKTVVNIESMRPEMKTVLLEKRFDMGKRLKMRSKKVEMKNENLQNSSRITELTVQNIKSICQTAINKIKQKETQLLDELNHITQTYAGQLRSGVRLDQIEMQMCRQHCEFIDQAFVSDCEMDLYDAYLAWESGAVELGDVRDTDTADTRRIDDIRFTPDHANVQHILGDLQLGKIEVAYQDQGTCLSSPVLIDTIDGRMADDDKLGPDLQNITVLFVDGIHTVLVNDCMNMCMKSFYTRDSQSGHSRLPLDNSPYGVTPLKENQVMVAVPASRQIVTVEVTPDLVLLSTITTLRQYYSLAVLSPSSLAAGGLDYDGYGIVDILDMAGHVLRSVTEHNDETLFAYPWNMCVNNKGNILVSDWEAESVTCLTSDGDVLWRYAPTRDRTLCCSSAITTTRTVDILLVDRGKVIQLTESGEFVRDVLTSEYDDDLADLNDIFCDKYRSFFLCTKAKVKEYLLMEIKV
ncbi:E3 ubiquitin-protein ligase TRIM71-like [Haliotis cracherodii]|uniref:E3 ubiquitin-protein ligase TRIM71-like n=1 Tax=Haliotis cracherodii TaxID=6455 RepID=UPI0039EA8163